MPHSGEKNLNPKNGNSGDWRKEVEEKKNGDKSAII